MSLEYAHELPIEYVGVCVYTGLQQPNIVHRVTTPHRVYQVTGRRLQLQLTYLMAAGPCISTDTACSSSLVSTMLAHAGLQHHETSAAISAGTNLMLVPDTSIRMAQLSALSPVGRSKTFDKAADGYGRGEGIVCMLLTLYITGVQQTTRPVLLGR